MANWLTYDATTKKRVKVAEKAISLFVKKIPEKKIDKMHFWKSDWSTWRCLAEIPELLNLRNAPESIKAAKKEPASAGPIVNRRQSARYASRLKVILRCDQIVFRTFSVDVSRDGLQLECPVPEPFLRHQLECYISSPDVKSGLRFHVTLVEDEGDQLRFKFVNPEPKMQEVLESWLLSQALQAA
jgi:hypothetical protein